MEFLDIIFYAGLALVFLIVEIVAIESDRYVLAALSFVGAFAAVLFFGHRLIGVTIDWWPALFIYLPIYLGIGIAVSTAKWLSYLVKFGDQLKDYIKTLTFCAAEEYDNNDLTKLKLVPIEKDKETGELVRERVYASFDRNLIAHLVTIYNALYYSVSQTNFPQLKLLTRDLEAAALKDFEDFIQKVTPSARREADRIAAWIFAWPAVLAHTILVDFLVNLGKRIAVLLDTIFGKLSRAIVRRSLN